MNDSEIQKRLKSYRGEYSDTNIEEKLSHAAQQAKEAYKYQYDGGLNTAQEECYYDECGAAYSLDRRIMFRINGYTKYYQVKRGTKISFGCQNQELTYLHFPDSLFLIMPNTFTYCNKLSYVHFGTGLQKISHRAFASCALKKVILPEGLYQIESEAFQDNSGLSLVSIPMSVQKIGNNVFAGCSKDLLFLVPKGFYKKYRSMIPKEQGEMLEIGYGSWEEADYYHMLKIAVRDGKRHPIPDGSDYNYEYNNYHDNYSDWALFCAEQGL